MSGAPHIFDRALLRQRRARTALAGSGPDFLLERFSEDVTDRLAFIQRTFRDVLVVGAHGGRIAAKLQSVHQFEHLVETETVAEMLSGQAGGAGVVADEEALPFAPGSFDLVVAGPTFQFVNDLPGVLMQIRQALRPDGLFLGGLFGGTTLTELRQAWIAAETEVRGGVSPRVSPFADVRDLGGLLQRAGFALPVVDADVFKVRYGSALALMQDLRAMGAGNVMVDRSRTPVSRRLLGRAVEIYADRFADPDGRIPATFELLVMTAWSPHESQQKPLKPGSATARLSDALGVAEGRLKHRGD